MPKNQTNSYFCYVEANNSSPQCLSGNGDSCKADEDVLRLLTSTVPTQHNIGAQTVNNGQRFYSFYGGPQF